MDDYLFAFPAKNEPKIFDSNTKISLQAVNYMQTTKPVPGHEGHLLL
jgi:hypothetical protein